MIVSFLKIVIHRKNQKSKETAETTRHFELDLPTGCSFTSATNLCPAHFVAFSESAYSWMVENVFDVVAGVPITVEEKRAGLF
jgi:hypothetical protein